jgi:hypothetical protein
MDISASRRATFNIYTAASENDQRSQRSEREPRLAGIIRPLYGGPVPTIDTMGVIGVPGSPLSVLTIGHKSMLTNQGQQEFHKAQRTESLVNEREARSDLSSLLFRSGPLNVFFFLSGPSLQLHLTVPQ